MVKSISARRASWLATTYLACAGAVVSCSDGALSLGSGDGAGGGMANSGSGATGTGTAGQATAAAGVDAGDEAGAAGSGADAGAGDGGEAGMAGSSAGAGLSGGNSGAAAGGAAGNGTNAGTSGAAGAAGGAAGGGGGVSGTAGAVAAGGTSGGTSGASGGTSGSGAAGGGGVSAGAVCGSPTVAALNTGNAWPSGTTQLIDFGLVAATDISPAFHSGSRAVATNASGRDWLLWDIPNRLLLQRGSGTLLGLQGPAFLVGTAYPDIESPPSTLEIRASSDGHLLGTITNTTYSSFGLADDGSYIWGIDAPNQVLSAWSPAGALLHSFSSTNLSRLGFQAAPAALITGGTDSALHWLNPLDGTQTASTTTYLGTFEALFADGSHFVTQASSSLGSTVRVYTLDVNLVATVSLSASGVFFGGQGSYFWADGAAYPLSDATFPSPAFTWTQALDPHPDRSPSSPTALAFNAKLAALGLPGATGDYCSATNDNLLHYGSYGDPSATGVLGCGRPSAVAGSDSGTIAASTASGQVLFFDAASHQLTQTIPGGSVSHLTLSADGKTLLALVVDPATKAPISADVYALPSGTLTKSWTSSPQFVRLSRGGSKLSSGCTVSTPAGDNSTALALPTSIRCEAVPVSAAGNVASNTEDPHFDSAASDSPFTPTNYYFSGTAATAEGPGYAVGWVDDRRLLVETYSFGSIRLNPIWTYVSSSLYDNLGNLLGSVPGLPAMTDFYTVSSTQILSNDDGNIYDLSTGAVVWASRGAPAAAVGAQVTWVDGNGVFVTTH